MKLETIKRIVEWLVARWPRLMRPIVILATKAVDCCLIWKKRQAFRRLKCHYLHLDPSAEVAPAHLVEGLVENAKVLEDTEDSAFSGGMKSSLILALVAGLLDHAKARGAVMPEDQAGPSSLPAASGIRDLLRGHIEMHGIDSGAVEHEYGWPVGVIQKWINDRTGSLPVEETLSFQQFCILAQHLGYDPIELFLGSAIDTAYGSGDAASTKFAKDESCIN